MSRADTDPDRTEEWRSLSVTPLLGMLAVVAALLDLGINRFAIRALVGTLPHPALITLSRWGELPRNLAAVSGLVALTMALLSFLRTPTHAPVRRRLSIAGFAGIFLPTTALATLLPADRTSPQIVLFATGAANVLAVLLGVTAARRAAPVGIRAGVAVMAVSALSAFTALVVVLFEPLSQSRIGVLVALTLKGIGEVGFMLTPLLVGVSVFPRGRTTRSRVALAVGVLAFAATAALGWWGMAELRADFAIVLYGAARVELWLEAAPAVYVLLFAAAVGIGAGALASGDAIHRQAGAGVLLLVASGYAARSPGRLLMTVLAVALLSRACLALGEAVAAARRAERRRDEPVGVEGAVAERAE